MTIEQLLASGDWHQRRQAVEALSRLADADLAQAMLEVVRKDHENLSALNAAMQILAGMGRAAPIKEVADLLNSADEQVRVYVPQILGLFRDEWAVPALLTALDDANENVRFNSIEALGEIRARAAVGALIRVLKEGDSFTRYAAVVALGKIGAALSTPENAADQETARISASIATALMPLLSEAYLAEPTVMTLGSLGRAEAVPSIFEWLENHSGDPIVALAALGQIARRYNAAPAAVFGASLIEAGHEAGWARLAQAVDALLVAPEEQLPGGREPGEASLEALLQDAGHVFGRLYWMQPANPLARRLLVRLLAIPAARQEAEAALSAGHLPAAPELIAALTNPDVELACSAAHVLAALRDPAALQPLLQALESENALLSAHAAEALGALISAEAAPAKQAAPAERAAAERAIDALMNRLNAPEKQVREAAIHALTLYPSPAAADRLAPMLAAEDPHLREAAVRVLAETGDSRAAEAAIAALADPDLTVRKAAVEVLPRTGSPQAAALLAQILQGTDASLRAGAARALAALPPSQALAPLARAARDPDAWVRMYACRSLGKLAQPESLPWLRACLADRMPPVRLAAMNALMETDPLAARRDVLQLLNDPDNEVRAAAQGYAENTAQPGNQRGEN